MRTPSFGEDLHPCVLEDVALLGCWRWDFVEDCLGARRALDGAFRRVCRVSDGTLHTWRNSPRSVLMCRTE